MKVARLALPMSAAHMPGPVRLPDGREGHVTRTGVVIGLLAKPRPPEVGLHAEIIQAAILHPRPFRWDQMAVRALLKVNQ
jgi:hypothetical protein